MKKLFLLLFVLCLTGCGNEDFSKVCIISDNSRDLKSTEMMKVNFNNKDEITKVVITRNYNGLDTIISSIKESASIYNNGLLKKDGIKISISKNDDKEFEVKYYLDASKMNESDLALFNLQKNSIKFFNKMRSRDIVCK